MKIIDHQLTGVEQCHSPNQDERPFGEVSLIVIHGISLPPATFGGNEVKALFTNTLDTQGWGLRSLAGVRVSSHLYIRRDGEVIQFVDFNRRAWHAGISSFHGREQCNDYSVGIEMEGTDKIAYTTVQYEKLAKVCASLMHEYGATEIVGHCHIAPGRKTDPGPLFGWQRFRRMLAARL